MQIAVFSLPLTKPPSLVQANNDKKNTTQQNKSLSPAHLLRSLVARGGLSGEHLHHTWENLISGNSQPPHKPRDCHAPVNAA